MHAGAGPRLARGQAVTSQAQGGRRAFSARDFLQKFQGLPGLDRSAFAAEWGNLSLETDPDLFFQGLLGLADRLRDGGQMGTAAELYAGIAGAGEEFQPGMKASTALAQARLDALQGKGSFGARFEVLAQRLAKDASDYRTIIPMLAGSVVFQTVRAASLGRLLSTAAPAWYRRGMGARFTAGLFGFAAEVPVFSLSSRGLQDLSGQPVGWSGGEVGRDLLGATITLGALKGTGLLAQRALQGTGSGQLSAWQKFNHAVLPQAAMFTGMMGAHKMESGIGLRPSEDWLGSVMGTLGSMISLGIGSRLGHRVLGADFALHQSALNWRANQAQFFPGALAGIVPSPALVSPSRSASMQMESNPRLEQPAGNSMVRLRGGKGKAEKSPVHVGAMVSEEAKQTFTPAQLLVRHRGIGSPRDFVIAAEYLGRLHPALGKLIDEVNAKNILLHVGGKDLTYSFAEPTFQGAVDRNSPDFGKKIVVEPQATPDILLHEILHTIPLHRLREILPEELFPIGSLHIPAVDPKAGYRQIREHIFENIRANETLSFGAQGLFYQLERAKGVTPVFHSKMMADLDGAWRQGGLEAIRITFPHYLPHYEERLGMSSALLALIVKVEGRTQLSDAEFKLITSASQGDIPFGRLIDRFQDYLNRHVQAKGLEIPAEFYSLKNIFHRMQIHEAKDLNADTMVRILDATFETLENWDRGASEVPRDVAERRLEIIPPPENSRLDRARLFVSYSAVVDRVLDNPPSSLAREEMAALVSYTRMVTPAIAGELADRLQVYLGPGFEDLRVSLGLILHEKGLKDLAWDQITRGLTPENLHQVLPWVLRLMGPERALELLRAEHQQIKASQETLSRQFRIWTADQFFFDEASWEQAVTAFCSHPLWFDAEVGANFGRWLFQRNKVDTVMEEEALMRLDSQLSSAITQGRQREMGFLRALRVLREGDTASGELRNFVNLAWESARSREEEALAALARLVRLGHSTEPMDAIQLRAPRLGLFSTEELRTLLLPFTPNQRQQALTVVELEQEGPWSHPKEVGRLANDWATRPRRRTGEKKEAYERRVFAQERDLLRLLDRSSQKTQGSGTAAPRLSAIAAAMPKSPPSDSATFGIIPAEQVNLMSRYFEDFYFLHKNWGKGIKWKPEDGIGRESHLLQRYFRAIEHDAAGRSRHFRAAFDFLQELADPAKDYALQHGTNLLDYLIGHHGLHLLQMAHRFEETEVAQDIYRLLFLEIPSREYRYEKEDRESGDRTSVIGHKDSDFLAGLESFAWTFRMDEARRQALAQHRGQDWLARLREEIQRGSSPVTLRGLDYLSREFYDEAQHPQLEAMLRLMIQQALLKPSRGNIRIALQRIQVSPLSQETRDQLLESLFRPLFDLIRSHQGVEIGLLRELQNLFPWQTPFLRIEDLPHYPLTEELLVSRLAGIPELTEKDRPADDRIRLAAFGAVGLPLQRHAAWAESLFQNADSAAELQGLTIRRDYSKVYERLGLPAAQRIPIEVSTEDLQTFIKGNRGRLETALNAGTGEEFEAVLRLCGRLLGSELRYLITRHKSGPSFSNSNMADFLFTWLRQQYEKYPESPAIAQVQEVLFSEGPSDFYRLEMARDLLGVAGTRERARRVFAQATRHLVFSSRVRRRLSAVQQGQAREEYAYLQLLLSIQYNRHPRHMISNFLLDRLEARPELRTEYEKFLELPESDNPLLLSELGMSQANSEGALVRDWGRSRNVDRMAYYLRALRFLRLYMFLETRTDWADEYYFNFSPSLVREEWDKFRKYFSETDFETLDFELRDYAEILATAGWSLRISRRLDAEYHNYRDYEFGDQTFDIAEDLRGVLKTNIRKTEDYYRAMILEDLKDRMEDFPLPDFIQSRQGLERDLLIWTLEALEPVQRNGLEQRLREAGEDQQRVRLLGEAAHLEKLLQGASVHPSVPRRYQRQFAVFQDNVPHRDPIEIERTLENALGRSRDFSLDIDMRRPLREGTIGGVYRGTLDGRPIVAKIIPHGKEEDIRSSLRLVGEIRRYLWADRYKAEGSRGLDDFLAFYERTILGEMNLMHEIDNAEALRAVLPKGFAIPDMIQEPSDPAVLLMEPLYSRRLRDLSAKQREDFFHQVDSRLIPAMLARGVFHYDLHPGNLGLHENGKIVLYDVGRVHRLTEEQRGLLAKFSSAALARNYQALPALLREMGTVRDEAAFARIGELLDRLGNGERPLQAMEAIYPRLADYGFVLNDGYVRLLLMYLTWEGTKASLRGEAGD